jgi:hypothetical protein
MASNRVTSLKVPLLKRRTYDNWCMENEMKVLLGTHEMRILSLRRKEIF